MWLSFDNAYHYSENTQDSHAPELNQWLAAFAAPALKIYQGQERMDFSYSGYHFIYHWHAATD
jgi:hypothetical protein